MFEIGSVYFWIFLAALLSALSCALLGVFLVLRKMSLLGDAISHSVLPGLALAFLLSNSRSVLPMLIGAGVFGLLTAVLTQFLTSYGKVERSAAMGTIFTSFFALGLIIIRQAADSVDIDPGCVLYGLLEFTPLDTILVFDFEIPRAVFILSMVLAANIVFVSLLYKELILCSFDPALATTLGISSSLVHYLLMTFVAATSVASFESVGSILVVAMLIVPGATARLFADRMGSTIFVACIVAFISAALGCYLAILIDTSVAGMMSVVAGAQFLLALFFAPRYGIVAKLLGQFLLGIRVLAEDMLGLIYRCQERDYRQRFPLSQRRIRQALGGGTLALIAVFYARQKRWVRYGAGDLYELTPKGMLLAESLVRSHRLWEAYLARFLNLDADHVHPTAMKLEHHTDSEMQRELAESTRGISQDPHGRSIPGAKK